jgi:hypothetical protein
MCYACIKQTNRQTKEEEKEKRKNNVLSRIQ